MKKLLPFLLLSSVAFATPAALYSPVPPPDSAFVRFINATPGVRSVTLDNTALTDDVDYAQASPYRVFKGGNHTLKSGSQSTSIKLEEGGFYTASLVAGHWWLNTDRSSSTLTQARISLYNLSSVPVALKTADGQLTLWNDFKPSHYDIQPVNPVKVSLAVFNKGTTLKLPETQLEANTAYSIIVVGDAKTLRASWVRNSTEVR